MQDGRAGHEAGERVGEHERVAVLESSAGDACTAWLNGDLGAGVSPKTGGVAAAGC